MAEDNLEICMWKEAINDENSTGGQGMRNSDKAQKCLRCEGYDTECPSYIPLPKGEENDTR